jgi:uncharacterized protein (TIGR03118 family)
MRLTTTFFTCALCIGFTAGRARASDRDDDRIRNDYQVDVLVSNQADEAPTTDAKLVNAWGISASPTSPWWVANNGTGSSTLYDGTGAKNALEVTVPGAPTGTVFNGGTKFLVATGAPSFFLFASEDGTISGWNPAVDRLNAKVLFTHAGSNYKGLAIRNDRLFASDFGDCKVVELDGAFAPVATAGGFADSTIPADFCPFGIQVIGDSIFVSYAKKNGDDDMAGRGNGFVREFNRNGHLLSRVASRGNLNSPWGMAMAPATFGRFGGCLLVGNFGDGRINAYCKANGAFAPAGALRENNRKITIDGLWGIGFGNGHSSGPTDVLYFAAGPDEEANGAFGRIVVGSPRCEL